MTNKERQKQLDKKKWLESERCEFDCSGMLSYCHWCKHEESLVCKATQEERETACLCATAYNRMQRARR